MYDIPHTPHGTRPPSQLLTRLLTIMRRIVMNWGMLYVMISECYLIDDGYRETWTHCLSAIIINIIK